MPNQVTNRSQMCLYSLLCLHCLPPGLRELLLQHLHLLIKHTAFKLRLQASARHLLILILHPTLQLFHLRKNAGSTHSMQHYYLLIQPQVHSLQLHNASCLLCFEHSWDRSIFKSDEPAGLSEPGRWMCNRAHRLATLLVCLVRRCCGRMLGSTFERPALRRGECAS